MATIFHQRFSLVLVLCIQFMILGTGVAHATATSGPQLSSVVDSVCGSGAFAAIQSSGQAAYVDFQSGDSTSAIDADRKTMKLSYACLLKPVKCNPSDSGCSPFDEIVAVYLRDRILSSQINLWNALINNDDSNGAMTVVTEAMRNAVDLCKYQHILAKTTPFTGARSDLHSGPKICLEIC